MLPDRRSKRFPQELKNARKARRLTQKELARLARISTVMENRYEADCEKSYHAVPRQDVYDRIVAALESFDREAGDAANRVPDGLGMAVVESMTFGELLQALRRHMREMGLTRLEVISDELGELDNEAPAQITKGDEMKDSTTIGGGSTFRYKGSRRTGFDIEFGDGQRYHFAKEDIEKLVRSKSGQIVVVGTSRTAPPPGSMGEYLMEHVTKQAIASYVASILVGEELAEIEKERPATLRFREYKPAEC